jgi:hypothetical protein
MLLLPFVPPFRRNVPGIMALLLHRPLLDCPAPVLLSLRETAASPLAGKCKHSLA